jgi:putative adhesin
MTFTRGARPIAVAAAAATVLAGCGVTRHTFDSAVPGKITRVVLEGGNGAVTLRIAAGATTRITRTTTRSSDPGKTYHLDGTVLRVDTSCGLRCSEDYDIRTPGRVAVSGKLASNKLTLDGISTADVSVSSGNIEISGATGAVRARTDIGSIKVTLTAAASVTAKTSSGNVTVAVPPGKYRVKAATAAGGKVRSAVTDTDGAADTLDLGTSRGNVTITR